MKNFVVVCLGLILLYMYLSAVEGRYFRQRRWRWHQKTNTRQTFNNCYNYTIERGSDPACNNITLKTPGNLSICYQHRGYSNNKNTKKSILSLMEQAVKRNGTEYRFSILLEDHQQGYTIHQVGGVFTSHECAWNIYVGDSSGPLTSKNVLKCSVKSGQSLILRYEKV